MHTKSKALKPRPLHPFPYLVKGQHPPYRSCPPLRSLTSAEKHILDLLNNGARVLFDIKAKKGLIYTFKQGLRTIMEITARMLSSLLHHGNVVAVAREGRLVHYGLTHQNHAWFLPE